MTEYFPQPEDPSGILLAYRHPCEWVEVAAQRNPNGTWSSLWECVVCTDVAVGAFVGPIPEGFCRRCHWVQHKPKRRNCEECKAPLRTAKEN